jgi:spoIIIJ-associated protein
MDMSDRTVEKAGTWLEQLLGNMALTVAVNARLEGKQNIWLTIDQQNLTEQQVETLIGTDGSILDALQYLANLQLNSQLLEHDHIFYTVELAGYRAKRNAELNLLAQQALAAIAPEQPEYRIERLSAAERRQVHLYLELNHPEIETFSEGREPNRQLVVRLRKTESLVEP